MGNTAWGGYAQGKGVADAFVDYSVEGFTDIDVTLNFGTDRKPIIRNIYYRPNYIKNSLIDIYFMMPKKAKTAQLFYGENKISDIKVK